MKISYNYSELKNRDKKLYSIQGTKISSTGISGSYLKVALACLLIFNIFGVIICCIKGEFLYWPIRSNMEFKLGFPIIFIGCPLAISYFLYYQKIQNYRIIEFLIAYFKPKRIINQNGKNIKFIDHKEKGFIERIL